MDPATKARFSGFGFGMPPLMMLALASVLGAGALWSLRHAGFFAAAAGSGLRAALRWGAVLAPVMIVVDLIAPFPRALNVGWPDAWLFYPAIAPVAEAALHLVPLALAFALTRRAWAAIALAALAEPALQAVLAAGLQPWQQAAVFLQVYALSLLGLGLLRRHGVAALLALRLGYYLFWHILWGAARLPLLFDGP